MNTAENVANIQSGNDRVMRARLADAKFFYGEDLKIPLADRRAKLDGPRTWHLHLGRDEIVAMDKRYRNVKVYKQGLDQREWWVPAPLQRYH